MRGICHFINLCNEKLKRLLPVSVKILVQYFGSSARIYAVSQMFSDVSGRVAKNEVTLIKSTA